MAIINNAIQVTGTGQASGSSNTSSNSLRAGDIKGAKETSTGPKGKIQNKLGKSNDSDSDSSSNTGDGEVAKESGENKAQSHVSRNKGKVKTTQTGELDGVDKNKDKDDPRGNDNMAPTDGLGINSKSIDDMKGTPSMPPGAAGAGMPGGFPGLPPMGGGGSGGGTGGGGGGIKAPTASKPQEKRNFTDNAREPKKPEKPSDSLSETEKNALEYSNKLIPEKNTRENFDINYEKAKNLGKEDLVGKLDSFMGAREDMLAKRKEIAETYHEGNLEAANKDKRFLDSDEVTKLGESYKDLSDLLKESTLSPESLTENPNAIEDKFEHKNPKSEERSESILDIDIKDSYDEDDIIAQQEEEPEVIIEDDDEVEVDLE